MSVYSGNSGIVQVGGTPSTIQKVQTFSVTESAATQSTNAMGDAWETHLTGKLSWSGSIECLLDRADTTGQNSLTIGSSVAVKLYPEGNASTRMELTGTATVTSIDTSVDQDAANTVKFEVTGNGALVKGVKA